MHVFTFVGIKIKKLLFVKKKPHKININFRVRYNDEKRLGRGGKLDFQF